MRRLGPCTITTLLLALGGCASHRGAAPTSAAVHPQTVVATTQPVRRVPRSALKLEQIEPRVSLPAGPATQETQESQHPPLEAVELYAQSRAALLDGDRAGATNLLEKAAARDPHSYQLHYELAEAYQGDSGASELSLAELEKAAEIEPDHLELQLNLGRQYLALGKTEAGLKHLRLAQETRQYRADDRHDAIVEFFLASALAHEGYDTAALQVYRRLIARLQSPSMAMRMDPETSLLLGHVDALNVEVSGVLMKLGQYEQAAAGFHSAVQRDPSNFELRSAEVHALTGASRFDDAGRAAADAVVRESASPRSVALLRDVYRSEGKENQAADALAQLYRQRPTDRPILYALSDLLRAEKRDDEAERVLASAAGKEPRDMALLRRRYQIRVDHRDLPSAARLLIDTSAAQPGLNDQIVPLWATLTRPTAAGRLRLSELQAMQVPASEEPAKLLWIARTARVWHHDAVARQALDQAVTLRPAYAPTFRELFETIWSEQDTDDAAKLKATHELIDRAASEGDNTLVSELKGFLLYQQDKPKEAAEALDAAAKLGDTSPDVLLVRANALQKAGDDKGFESILWQVTHDWPTLATPYLELYAYELRHQSAAEADHVLTAWLAADPQNPTALQLQARQAFAGGRVDSASATLDRLLVEHSDDPEVLNSLRQFYAQTQSLTRFTGKLEELRARNPRNWALMMVLAETYASENRLTEATQVADAIRATWADDPDVLYALSGLYSRLGQKDTSQRVLEEVLKLEPNHAGACNDLAYTLAEQGKELARAEALVRKAIAAEPHNASFLDSLGWVLYKRGRFSEARQYLDKAVGPGRAAGEADPVVLDHRGDVLYRLGDRAAAAADWTRAAERIASQKDDRDDLKELRLQLLTKQKQIRSGQPASVAPTAESKSGTGKR